MNTPKNMDLYYQTYTLDQHPEGLTREQVMMLDDGGQVGACHDLLFVSIMHQEDGGISYVVVGRAADNEALTPIDEFKVWAMMASRLANTLPEGFSRELCKATFAAIRRLVVKE